MHVAQGRWFFVRVRSQVISDWVRFFLACRVLLEGGWGFQRE